MSPPPPAESGAHHMVGDESMEFGRLRISSGHVNEFQQLGYFGSGTGRVSRSETTLAPKGEVVVFEVFFDAGLHLPCHRFGGLRLGPL